MRPLPSRDVLLRGVQRTETHILVLRRPRCSCLPPPHRKVTCYTETEARETERLIARDKGGFNVPVRFYRCPRGKWHWTREGA